MSPTASGGKTAGQRSHQSGFLLSWLVWEIPAAAPTCTFRAKVATIYLIRMNVNTRYMNVSHVNMTMLRVLTSLAETRSFSRTAEQLCITPSAVSHTVRGLEAAVGTQLVVRDRKGVELTGAGANALEAASSALDALRSLLSVGQKELTGTVRLASVVSATTTIVPIVLAFARRNHPSLNITLLVGTDAEVAKWVDTSIADVGLAHDPGSGLCEPLMDDQLYAIAASQTPFGRKTSPACSSEFDCVDFVMSAAGCAPMLESLFDEWDVKPNVVATVSDMNALFALVGAGHGVSIVPGLAFPADWRQRVVRRRLEPIEPRPLVMKLGCKDLDKHLMGLLAILREVCAAARQLRFDGSDRVTTSG